MKKRGVAFSSRVHQIFGSLNVFFYFLGFYLVVAMLPIIVKNELGIPAIAITFLFMLRYIFSAIYDSLVSKLIKSITVKTALISGILGLMLVFGLFYFVRNFFVYIILFIFLGILGSLNELKMQTKAEREGSKGVGKYYFAFFSASFISFLTSGFILDFFSVEGLFLTAIVCFLVPLVILSFTSKFKKKHKEVDVGKLLLAGDFIKEEKEIFSKFHKSAFFVFTTKFFLTGFASLRNLYLPLIVVQTFQLSAKEVSLILALSFLPSLIVPPFIEKILKTLPSFFFVGGHKRKALDFGLFLLCISCFLIPFSLNAWSFALLIFLASVGFSLAMPLLDLVIVKYYPKELEEQSGMLHMFAQLGKVFLMLTSAVFLTLFSDNMKGVFFVPAVVFLILFVYLLYDSFIAGKVLLKGTKRKYGKSLTREIEEDLKDSED